MKYLCQTLLLLGLLPVIACAAPGSQRAVIPERIARSANALATTGIAPAVVIAMVSDGQSAVAGYGKLADGDPPNAQTVFQIGSVTKTFTALLLARDVHKGSLSLDTPVADLLPGFTLPTRDGKAITLGLLAEQSSGLPRLATNMDETSLVDPYAQYNAVKLKQFLASYKMTSTPGREYVYSNLGYGLLGYALSVHAGTSYGALLEKDILRPLALTSTGVTRTGAVLPPAVRKRLAPGHGMQGQPAGLWHFQSATAGAGTLYSDAHDLLVYLKANMGIDATPLSVAMRLAHTPRRAASHLGRVGLGWLTTPSPDGDIIWHNGAVGGYSAFFGFRADGKCGVVVLANSLEAAQDVTELGMAALSQNLPVPTIINAKAIVLPSNLLEGYAGKYTLAPGFVLTVFLKGDQLYGQATGQGAFPLDASARDAYFNKMAGIRIDFRRNAKGTVDALVLHQLGHTTDAPRQP